MANESSGDSGTSRNASADRSALRTLHLWQIQAIRDVLFIGAFVALIWLGYALRAVTVPLLVALLLAYLFEPLIAYLDRRANVSRPVAITGLLCTVGLSLIVALGLIVPAVVSQTTRLAQQFQDGVYHERLEQLVEYVPADYRERYTEFLQLIDVREPEAVEPDADADSDADTDQGEVESADTGEPDDDSSRDDAGGTGTNDASGGVDTNGATEQEASDTPTTAAAIDEAAIRSFIREELDITARDAQRDNAAGPDWLAIARGGTTAVFGVIAGIVAFGLLAFLIPFYFFFFSLWYPSIVDFGRDLIPPSNRERLEHLLAKMDRAVSGFVRGRIIISLIMGVLLAIGWMICGVPYAIVLGLVIGIFCAVPYLGGVGVPLAVSLLALEQLGLPAEARMGWLHVLIWPTVVFVIVQMIEAYVLTPAIAGKATNLDPVTIIVAVIAGGSVMGVYGMLLAIPVAACGKILITDVFMPKVRDWAKGRASDPLPL